MLVSKRLINGIDFLDGKNVEYRIEKQWRTNLSNLLSDDMQLPGKAFLQQMFRFLKTI